MGHSVGQSTAESHSDSFHFLAFQRSVSRLCKEFPIDSENHQSSTRASTRCVCVSSCTYCSEAEGQVQSLCTLVIIEHQIKEYGFISYLSSDLKKNDGHKPSNALISPFLLYKKASVANMRTPSCSQRKNARHSQLHYRNVDWLRMQHS